MSSNSIGKILGTLNIKIDTKIFRIKIVANINIASLLRDVSIKLGFDCHLSTVNLSVKYLEVITKATYNKK